VDAPREVAELRDGELELVHGCRQQAVDLRARSAAQATLSGAQPQGERDDPLLRAVVEIALDPAALLVRGQHDVQPVRPGIPPAGAVA
jgi:hypothetical protein